MNLFEQYGIKEVADVTLYAISLDKYDNEVYIPVIYFDTLKVSTVELSAEQASARGGLGNPELITWDFGKEITVNLQDALYTPASQSLVWGGRFNLGKIKIFGVFNPCEYNEENPLIEKEDFTGVGLYNCMEPNTFKKERINGNVNNAIYKYPGKETDDHRIWPKETNVGPFYMKDFFDEQGNRYGDCAELIVDSFEDFKYSIFTDEEKKVLFTRYSWINPVLKLVSLNGELAKGYYEGDDFNIVYEENNKTLEGELYFILENERIDILDFYSTYTDNIPFDFLPSAIEEINRKVGTFCIVLDRNYYNFSKENTIYPIDYGIKNATKLDRMERVVASRDFVIDVDKNLLHYNYSLLSKYSNTNLKFYLDPFTMKPYESNCSEFKSAIGFTLYGNFALIRRGSIYYKWTRDINAERSLGKLILVDVKHYPGYFKLVGETYSRRREDGFDERLQFEIPLCKMSTNTTLLLEAEGEPTVYDFSLKVMKPKRGPMMKLTLYKVKKNIYTALNGGKYCSNSTSVVPQEKVMEYNNCCPSPNIIEKLFPTGDKFITDCGMIDVNQEDLIPFVENRIKIIGVLRDIGIPIIEEDIIPARYNVDKPIDEAYFSTAIRYWLAKPNNKPIKKLREISILSPVLNTVYTIPNDFAHPYDDEGEQVAPYLILPTEENLEEGHGWLPFDENNVSEDYRKKLLVKLIYDDDTFEYLTQEIAEDYNISFNTGSGN